MCYVKGSKIVVCRKAKEAGGICRKVVQKLPNIFTIQGFGFDPYYYTVVDVNDKITAMVTLIHPKKARKHNICNATMTKF